MLPLWRHRRIVLYLYALAKVYATAAEPDLSIGPLPTSVPDETTQTTAAIASSFAGAVILETVESLPNDPATTVTETFLPTTFSQYATQTDITMISVTTQDTTLAAVIGPGGVGWQLPSLASGEPVVQPPTTIPAGSETSGVADKTPSPNPSSAESTTTPTEPVAASSTTIAALVTTAADGSEATDVLTATDGTHHTTPVIWIRTIIPAGQTLNGVVIPTAEPAWACSGPLCNPQCLVPLVSCQPTDENGKSGTNGFAFATVPPSKAPLSPTGQPTTPAASLPTPSADATTTIQTPSPSPDTTDRSSTTTRPSTTTPTTTSSSTSTSTSTRQLCDWSCKACVGSPSPVSGNGNGLSTTKTTGADLPKRTFTVPKPGQSIEDWFVRRVANSVEVVQTAHTRPHVPVGPDDIVSLDLASSAIVGDFPVNRDARYSVSGLFGCTSVIAVSRSGMWISHLWQKPFDKDFDGGLGTTLFENDVLRFLSNGGQSFDRNGAAVNSPGLINLDKLAKEQNAQFIIVTPRALNKPPGIVRYPAEINAISQRVDLISKGAPVKVLDYLAPEEKEANDPELPRGKVLIQYDPQPVAGCNTPTYQVWLEAQHMSAFDDTWLPLNQKRDGSAPVCSTTLATSARSSDTSAPSSDTTTAASSTETPSSATPPKPINTVLPGKPSATPATSAHNLTIWQGLGIETNQPDVYLYANVSDNVGLVLATAHAKLDWSKNLTLITDTTPRHTIVITPTSSVDNNARKRVSGALGNKPQFTKGSVLVAVDDLPVFDAANVNEGNQEPWKQDKPGAWFKTVFGSKPFAMSNRNLWSLLAF